MSDGAKKAISTMDLATAVLGLLKTGAVVFAMVLIEWSRKKQKLAENQKAVAETNLDVKLHQDAIQKEADAKSPDDIIDSFLGRK